MHIFLKGPVLVPCPKCGKPVRPHRPHMVCSNWGKMGSTLFFIFYTIVDFLPWYKSKALCGATP